MAGWVCPTFSSFAPEHRKRTTPWLAEPSNKKYRNRTMLHGFCLMFADWKIVSWGMASMNRCSIFFLDLCTKEKRTKIPRQPRPLPDSGELSIQKQGKLENPRQRLNFVLYIQNICWTCELDKPSSKSCELHLVVRNKPAGWCLLKTHSRKACGVFLLGLDWAPWSPLFPSRPKWIWTKKGSWKTIRTRTEGRLWLTSKVKASIYRFCGFISLPNRGGLGGTLENHHYPLTTSKTLYRPPRPL